MKALFIPTFGDPDVLKLDETAEPELAPGTVRIEAHASGVNFADLLMRMGRYPEAPPPPFVPGYEVAGTVLEVGPDRPAGMEWLVPGAKVMAVTKFGGYAEQVVTPAVKVCPLPADWSYEEGAAFLINAVTAWLGLEPMARIRREDRVLIHGVAGGVGLAALQIARAGGCRVAGTCSRGKRDRVLAQGAELVLDPGDADWIDALGEWAPEGPDVILEPRGGKGLKESLELVRPLGSVVSFGFREIIEREHVDPSKAEMATGRLLWFNPLALVERSVGVHMLNIMNLWDDPWTFRHVASALQRGIDAGHYRPVVDRVLPLADVAEAHRCLHARQNVGKVVLSLSASDSHAKA
jgi:NADPH:quinone reductase-like Zn-dependent oxidoreductase